MAATAVRVTGRRIFVAGRQGMQGNGFPFAVARLLSAGVRAGALDRRFGRNGIALLPTPRVSEVKDLATQENGKVVVLGTIYLRRPDFALTRLLPDGSLDRSFGSGGMATVDVGLRGSGQALAIQRDGKLVVAGVAGELGESVALARHLPGTCSVPRLLGRTLAAARRLLAAGNCRLGRKRAAFSARVPRGRVLAQSARPGKTLADYAFVAIIMSRGTPRN